MAILSRASDLLPPQSSVLLQGFCIWVGVLWITWIVGGLEGTL